MKRYFMIVVIGLITLMLSGCINKYWPLNENTNGVPEPTFERVDFITTSLGSTSALYEAVTERESKEYLHDLQDVGFVDDVVTREFLNNYYFSAKNSKLKIKIKYNRNPKGTVSIILNKYN